MKLDPNWRQSWRWLSVHALAATGALPGVWLTLPDDWRAAVPAGWLAVATVITAALGVYGRLVQQPVKTKDDDNAEHA
jgi:hypothetical protein